MVSLKHRAKELAGQLVAWRRDLHRHPELGLEEHRTAATVARTLQELGLEVRTGIAGTGVLGLLRAPASRGAGVLLRADMDALPIQEVPGREYGSTVAGCMHACGHDGHTAMLLGAATLLAPLRDEVTRDVLFCFQPAEENAGGARKMIEQGALDWVAVGQVFALHLWTPFPAGSLHVRPGAMMAGQDEFRARIVGSAGHGALPHRARDPIVAAAHAIVALQSVVSRAVDPLEAAVVSVGLLHAGSAPNVIPPEASLCGTLRAFTPGVRETLRRRVREVLEGTAAAHGCAVELELIEGYPPVINDRDAVDRARRVAREVFGEGQVCESSPLATAEDFAYFLEERPGAFMFLGAGNAQRGLTASHHSPEFDFDEAVLAQGAELLARLALSAGGEREPHGHEDQ
jgi:amidohydrolase